MLDDNLPERSPGGAIGTAVSVAATGAAALVFTSLAYATYEVAREKREARLASSARREAEIIARVNGSGNPALKAQEGLLAAQEGLLRNYQAMLKDLAVLSGRQPTQVSAGPMQSDRVEELARDMNGMKSNVTSLMQSLNAREERVAKREQELDAKFAAILAKL